jgi:hypothetical protein
MQSLLDSESPQNEEALIAIPGSFRRKAENGPLKVPVIAGEPMSGGPVRIELRGAVGRWQRLLPRPNASD